MNLVPLTVAFPDAYHSTMTQPAPDVCGYGACKKMMDHMKQCPMCHRRLSGLIASKMSSDTRPERAYTNLSHSNRSGPSEGAYGSAPRALAPKVSGSPIMRQLRGFLGSHRRTLISVVLALLSVLVLISVLFSVRITISNEHAKRFTT
jgi:hypothetical protein